jgi:hypothetical protein
MRIRESRTDNLQEGCTMKPEILAKVVDKPFDPNNENTPFGKRWDAETLVLTQEHLQALQEGKLIAIDVMMEYVLLTASDNGRKESECLQPSQ